MSNSPLFIWVRTHSRIHTSIMRIFDDVNSLSSNRSGCIYLRGAYRCVTDVEIAKNSQQNQEVLNQLASLIAVYVCVRLYLQFDAHICRHFLEEKAATINSIFFYFMTE